MKNTIFALVLGVGLIAGAYYLVGGKNTETKPVMLNNVEIVDGKQIIQIDVKGGYSPKKSVAQAGIPTVLRFNTKGTFDCSSAVSIPSLDINKVLPSTGTTDFDIGTPEQGVLEGRCSMGMYFFAIDFIQ